MWHVKTSFCPNFIKFVIFPTSKMQISHVSHNVNTTIGSYQKFLNLNKIVSFKFHDKMSESSIFYLITPLPRHF